MSDRKMTARLFRPLPKIAMVACAASMTLAGCDTVLPSFVGKSKAVQDQEKAEAIPPATPPSTASFLHQDRLTDYASGNILPPTLPMDDVDQGVGEDTSSAARDFHKPIAVAPLSSDNKALEPLGAAATRAAAVPNAHFVLLVLSPPATDASTMDRNNEAARLAATAATKLLGDNGIAADKVEVSMATNPSVGTGELRLYQR
ncbi:MAG: hypothetical protein KGQ70_08165 [Alphaproteobacteria bacterium]|nr:hypothetical protein [Alphaproteobacteria bacterium]